MKVALYIGNKVAQSDSRTFLGKILMPLLFQLLPFFPPPSSSQQ